MIELGYSHSSHLPAHQVCDFIGQIYIADSCDTHRRNKLKNTTGCVIVLKIAFHIDCNVKWNSRIPVHRDFLKSVKRFSELFRPDAHTIGARLEIGMSDVEIIRWFYEVGIDLRTSPI